ncbi:hypothetical protein AJ80_00560 [Polytolypa hystricis UAMH7299]|uniref:SIS domain-containing protein n=1 Tax=Polytolypa hystricis (strain UAMH7299) TaxID=1447883 RepID=A0A2B7Z3Y9_POLH7|nr:hypothetical protein AJ80_00560 [Polytolypa hystricis UAMH7299]
MTFSLLARKRRRPPSPPSPPTLAPLIAGNIASLPMTPPDPDSSPMPALDYFRSSITTALHVISTERAALANLERVYLTEKLARDGMELAVSRVAKTVGVGGKLVVSGVGKSGKIGKKAVATMNSLGIHSSFLHPTEALHGDLGIVRPNDTVLLISFSGKTSELLALISHLPSSVSIIAITACSPASSCPLLARHDGAEAILLPAPVHEHEDISFGLAAPTTSTTVALALCDALALAVARKLHTLPGRGPAEVFRSFHPGGAIGASLSSSATTPPLSSSTSPSATSLDPIPDQVGELSLLPSVRRRRCISDLATLFSTIPLVHSSSHNSPGDIRVVDILRAAVQCPAGKSWVLLSPTEIVPPRRTCALTEEGDLKATIVDISRHSPISIHKADWICVPRFMSIEEVQQRVGQYCLSGREGGNTHDEGGNAADHIKNATAGRVIALVDEASGDVVGVVDAGDLYVDAS